MPRRLQNPASGAPRSPIRAWPKEERPRERLIQHGPQGLSEAQLLAILLRTGTDSQNALDVARQILERFGGVAGLCQAGTAELCKVGGIGLTKAATIQAALELGRRALAQEERPAQFRGGGEVARYYLPRLSGLKQEVFLCALLDSKNRLMKDLAISVGSLTASLVHPREVFLPAVRESAAAVLFVHNHPSGDPSPSEEDRVLTRRLRQTGEVLGIPVLDHIIIGNGRYVSFQEEGWLD